jgi:hypothetical protein
MLVACSLLIATTDRAHAQPGSAFEVASIKRNVSGSRRGSTQWSDVAGHRQLGYRRDRRAATSPMTKRGRCCGLIGRFDFSLTRTPDLPTADPSAVDGASIFTALQEQLDLKLEPQRGPVAVIMVDSADRPVED